MMMHLSSDVIKSLQGKSLVTAESCTGGGIGAALTAVSGSSAVYKGGIISYTNWVKENALGVSGEMLEKYGAVSQPVAQAMAEGARKALQADIAISVTGLAGPGGDEYGNPVGTVFVGYVDSTKSYVNEYHFYGDREDVRKQAICTALQLILEENR